MSRAPQVRALLAAAVLASSVYVSLTSSPRLGLDLRGGTQIVLQTRSTDRVVADAESTDRVREVLRGRIDALGVSEPTLVRAGDRRIVVELPGVQDPRRAAEVIGRTAQLTFRPVVSAQTSPTPHAPGAGTLAAAGGPALDEDGQPLTVGPVALSGEAVSHAVARLDPQTGTSWGVALEFADSDTAWQELTARAACAPAEDPARRVAILLDDRVISSPQVNPSVSCGVGIVGGRTEITGRFTDDQARTLATLIQGGALPLPVEIVEQRTVGPTLGAAAIEASWQAGLLGVLLTAGLMIVVYRLLGWLAAIALVGYALISYAALVAIGATLTLPGLAGFVLAIGLAIDANVLVFERAREEYAAARKPGASPGYRLRRSVDTGFAKAWNAILDSNVTTVIAAGLLFVLASGPVRGFGVTLSIGVAASMFSALVLTRVLTDAALSRRFIARRPAVTGLATTGRLRRWLRDHGPDLMGRSHLWLTVSVGVVIVSVAGIGLRGLNLGVEFTGGRLLQFATSQPVPIDQARAAISSAGFPRAVVQTSSQGQGEDVTVRTPPLTNDQAASIERAVHALGGHVVKERDDLIGPSLGAELRRNALLALGAALLGQLGYLAVRFRPAMAAAAVLAMFHDVLAVVGIFAWLGKPIDGVFLAAALTIIGLSINDSVVLLDRVRELRQARPRDRLAAVINAAIWQTVPRTINTGLGAMVILAALALLGGDSLTDFAIALLLGLVLGTWSSAFTVAPLFLAFDRRWSSPAGPRARR